MTSYDSHLADSLEAHDNPVCEHCGERAWAGEYDDEGRCQRCQDAAEDDAPVGEVPPHLGVTTAQAERARLEHDRLRDGVLALRAETDMDSPGWWDAYQRLMDVADLIERGDR